MSDSVHLWAIGYDDLSGAQRLRDQIAALAQPVPCLRLEDLVVLIRKADGSYTLDRQPFPSAGKILDGHPLGFLVGIALAVPLLTAASVEALLGLAGSSISKAVGIEDQFIGEVKAMMRPGTSAVLMLDNVRNLEAALRALKGLGGTVLKTNVDVERAKLLQSTLRAKSIGSSQSDKSTI